MLTQSYLKSILHYDKETGVFTRLKSLGNSKKGQQVGWFNSDGYLKTEITGKTYSLHRLVFLYENGKFPNEQVDHLNRIKSDNSFKNLKECSHFENQQNRGNNNVGVYKEAYTGKWRASFFGKHSKRFKTHLAACYARHTMEIA